MEKDIGNLPDINKPRGLKMEETILAKSIENRDIGYIQVFLQSAERNEEIKKLNDLKKEKLAQLLVEFLDTPQRLAAMESIYEIIKDVGRVDSIHRALVDRANDFNKLIYLKGKLDYLRYMATERTDNAPENEHTEQ
ncbi:hypothetical protein ENBRE01_0083 [Enteropsectra breve]|nr:hypothetical protein ENBRE01_0083 [Enteropsectra breve]